MARRGSVGCFLCTLAWLTLLAGPARTDPAPHPEDSAQERGGLTPEAVLEHAFRNFYDCDTTARIELVMRNKSGVERRRLFETASKRIDGRVRSIGRLVEPAHLRGMTVMTVEVPGRSEDTFVYLPSMKRVRRVTAAQRADSFLGSDLTYEDLERRRVEDFVVESSTLDTVEGEPAYRVRARPRREESYERIDFLVAQADWALLATRYYKRDATEPFRTIAAPRAHMVTQDGHVLPTRLLAGNRLRGTSTEVVMLDLEVNPEIDDRLFSVLTLEQERALE